MSWSGQKTGIPSLVSHPDVPQQAKEELQRILQGEEIVSYIPYEHLPVQPTVSNSPTPDSTEKEWIVKDIVERKKIAGVYKWKVLWQDESTSWEIEESFVSSDGQVTDVWADYESAHKRIQTRTKSKQNNIIKDNNKEPEGIKAVIQEKWNAALQEELFKVQWTNTSKADSWVSKNCIFDNGGKLLFDEFKRTQRKRRISTSRLQTKRKAIDSNSQ